MTILWESILAIICFPLIHFVFLLIVERINRNLKEMLDEILVSSSESAYYGIDDDGLSDDDNDI